MTEAFKIELINNGTDLIEEESVQYRETIDDVQHAIYIEKVDGHYFLKDKEKRFSAITIDFSSPFYRHRGGVELLPKAFRGLAEKRFIDATAGWARDAWLMAYRGFTVELKERNPYLIFLLEKAISQAKQNEALSEIAQRIILNKGDAVDGVWPSHLPVYIDPMFPEKKKKAKVKNPMQALHTLLGGEEADANVLLVEMLKKTSNRVIVKRPKGAPYLADLKPNHSIQSPNTRLDIYLKNINGPED